MSVLWGIPRLPIIIIVAAIVKPAIVHVGRASPRNANIDSIYYYGFSSGDRAAENITWDVPWLDGAMTSARWPARSG